MDAANVADARAVAGKDAENGGEDADLLDVLDPEGAEELRFLRIARHLSPSNARAG